MKVYRLLFVAAFAVVGTASASPGRGTASCSVRSIAVTPVDAPTFMGAGLSVAEGAQGRLTIDRAVQISRPCASAVRDVVADQILLSDNSVIELVDNGAAVRRDYDKSLFPLAGKLGNGPLLGGKRPETTAKIHEARSAGGITRLYVGLWQVNGQSVIAKFVTVDGVSKPAVKLISSSRTIASVGYSPDLDSNAGSLSVLQKSGGVARITYIRFKTDGWERSI